MKVSNPRMALMVVLASLGQSVDAGELTILDGRGVEVCEHYADALREIRLLGSLLCERDLPGGHPGLSEPSWRDIDAWDNRELLREIDEKLLYASKHERQHAWESRLKDRIEVKQAILQVSEFDLDNDSNPDRVLRYFRGWCPGMPTYGIKHVPLLPGGGVNADLLAALYPHEGRTSKIFFFSGRTYFDIRSGAVGHGPTEGWIDVFYVDGPVGPGEGHDEYVDSPRVCRMEFDA